MKTAYSRLPPIADQFLKYALVGVANVALHVGAFNVLRLAGVPPLVANGSGFAIASVQSFTLNRNWSFRDTSDRSVLVAYPLFLAFTLVGLGIHTAVFAFLTQYTSHWGQAGENLALIGAVPAAVLWNFFAYRRWTFVPADRR